MMKVLMLMSVYGLSACCQVEPGHQIETGGWIMGIRSDLAG